jgi:hypothetical protein
MLGSLGGSSRRPLAARTYVNTCSRAAIAVAVAEGRIASLISNDRLPIPQTMSAATVERGLRLPKSCGRAFPRPSELRRQK